MDGSAEIITREARFDGVRVALLEITPARTGNGQIDGFCAELAEILAGRFEESFVPYAVRAYETSDDPRKRWRYAPLTVRAVFAAADRGKGRTAVRMTLTASGETPKKTVRTRLWDVRTGRMIPTWFAIPRKAEKKR